CGVFETWARIVLPAAKSGLAIVAIFAFYNVWGEYTLCMTLATKETAMPISVGVALLKSEGGWQYGVLGAVITVALIPPILIFMIFQKQLVSGVMSGAIKG
ncbi:MAG: carbohydrate ABC transporter permease, partial [Eubacteriales bacterium]|nr:carbohydrate ABC transporter permease [Eubacteriales bacterium]